MDVSSRLRDAYEYKPTFEWVHDYSTHTTMDARTHARTCARTNAHVLTHVGNHGGNHKPTALTVQRIDRSLANFIQTQTARNDTILVIWGDHGQKFFADNQLPTMWFNRLNSLNPALFFVVPRLLLSREQVSIMQSNEQNLVTMLDLRATVLEFGRLGVDLIDVSEKKEHLSAHAFSLLRERVPFDRTCEDARIPLEFCTLTSSSVALPEHEESWFRKRIVIAINRRVELRDDCVALREEMFEIGAIELFESSRDVLSIEMGRVMVTLVARTEQFTLEDDDRLKFEGMFGLDVNGTVDPHVSSDGASSLLSLRRVSKFRGEACTRNDSYEEREFCVCRTNRNAALNFTTLDVAIGARAVHNSQSTRIRSLLSSDLATVRSLEGNYTGGRWLSEVPGIKQAPAQQVSFEFTAHHHFSGWSTENLNVTLVMLCFLAWQPMTGGAEIFRTRRMDGPAHEPAWWFNRTSVGLMPMADVILMENTILACSPTARFDSSDGSRLLSVTERFEGSFDYPGDAWAEAVRSDFILFSSFLLTSSHRQRRGIPTWNPPAPVESHALYLGEHQTRQIQYLHNDRGASPCTMDLNYYPWYINCEPGSAEQESTISEPSHTTSM